MDVAAAAAAVGRCRSLPLPLRAQWELVSPMSSQSKLPPTCALQTPTTAKSHTHNTTQITTTIDRTRVFILKERTWSLTRGGNCHLLSTVLSGHQTVSPRFSSTIHACKNALGPLVSKSHQAPYHSTPLPPFIQVGQKPQINSSGGAKAHAKPTPHPRDGDCFYLINKTCRTQAQKCRLSTTSAHHSPSPLARRGRVVWAGGKT